MNDASRQTRPMLVKNRGIQLLVLAAWGLYAASVTLPLFERPAVRGKLTMQRSNLRQVAIAWALYTHDEGHPPKSLADIAITEKYGSAWTKIGKYTIGSSPKTLDWLYFPERLRDDKKTVVILASPEPFNGDRIVAWSDLRCQIISEEEYQTLSAKR